MTILYILFWIGFATTVGLAFVWIVTVFSWKLYDWLDDYEI